MSFIILTSPDTLESINYCNKKADDGNNVLLCSHDSSTMLLHMQGNSRRVQCACSPVYPISQNTKGMTIRSPSFLPQDIWYYDTSTAAIDIALHTLPTHFTRQVTGPAPTTGPGNDDRQALIGTQARISVDYPALLHHTLQVDPWVTWGKVIQRNRGRNPSLLNLVRSDLPSLSRSPSSRLSRATRRQKP